jgi:hypothetical protein
MLYKRNCSAAQINEKVIYTQVSLCWENPSVNASVPILKDAAAVTWDILDSVKVVKSNKKAFHRLAYHAADLIVMIWRSYMRSKIPEDWLSPQLKNILQELLENLNSILEFVNEHISMNIIHRLISSADDKDNIQRYHKQLKLAIDKFEVQSHISTCRILTQILKKQERLSDQIQRRNDVNNIAWKHNAAEAYSTGDKRHGQTKPKRQVYSVDVERKEGTAETVSLKVPTALPQVKRRARPKKAKIIQEVEGTTRDSNHQTEALLVDSSDRENQSDEEESEAIPTINTPRTKATCSSFSFTNSGGGKMINQGIGNITNTNISNISNDRSDYYHYH